MTKVVTRGFVLTDNCIPANSISLYLSLTLGELLMSHKVQIVVKLFHLYKVVIAAGWIYIATGWVYIATGWVYIATGWVHISTRQLHDLMSDKYITSLLLIKMLKAFLRVNIKSQFTNSHCYKYNSNKIYVFKNLLSLYPFHE